MKPLTATNIAAKCNRHIIENDGTILQKQIAVRAGVEHDVLMSGAFRPTRWCLHRAQYRSFPGVPARRDAYPATLRGPRIPSKRRRRLHNAGPKRRFSTWLRSP